MKRRKQAEQGDPASIESEDPPFLHRTPKLLSHQPGHQVILCDYANREGGETLPCILKLFSPRHRKKYNNEIDAYDYVLGSDGEDKPLPNKLWSGTWSKGTYQKFLGNLPSILRPSESEVYALMLEHIDSAIFVTGIDSASSKQLAVGVALRSLRSLHSIGLVHGDIAESNVLIKRGTNHSYSAIWVDFSTSVTNASLAIISREWDKALKYFSQLVRSRCSRLTIKTDLQVEDLLAILDVEVLRVRRAA